MSPLKKIADQNLPKTAHQKPTISTSYSSSSSEANSPIKTSKFAEQISPTKDIVALQNNFSPSKSSHLLQRSTFKEQLEQKLQQKRQAPQKPLTPPKPAPRSPQKQAPNTPGPSTPKRPAPSTPSSTPSASVQKIVTEKEVLSHATPDVDLKPDVSSLSSDSEQNWDEDKLVKTFSIAQSKKGSKMSEQSNVLGNLLKILFVR